MGKIFKLPDISGPGVSAQALFQLCGMPVQPDVQLRVEAGHEFEKEGADILFALLQRGQVQFQNGKPVIQVLSKFMFADHLPQVPVGGGNDAGVVVDDAAASHMNHLFFLNRTQQFGLHGKAELADFVQKNGSLMGHLKIAQFSSLFRAGKRPFVIAEQLALQQGFRNGGAVYRDKRIFRP